jgi:hypothetical protein
MCGVPKLGKSLGRKGADEVNCCNIASLRVEEIPRSCRFCLAVSAVSSFAQGNARGKRRT